MKNNTEKIKNKLNIHTTNYVGRGNQYKGIQVQDYYCFYFERSSVLLPPAGQQAFLHESYKTN